MAKYSTGTYLVRFFDRYGTKQRDLPAVNYTDAYDLGRDQMGDGSFVVLRVLHNSLDPHPTVDCRQDYPESEEVAR